MKEQKLFSIGRAGRICGVSTRMLRYYEEIGLIITDHIDSRTGYRYYSMQTLRDVQAVRYLADAGFSLEEIKLCRSQGPDALQESFIKNIKKTEDTIDYYHQRLAGMKDWCSIIIEGKAVLRHRGVFNASVIYFPERRCFRYRREHSADEKEADLISEIEYMTASKQNGRSMVDVGGALMFAYDSYGDRMERCVSGETIYQIIYRNDPQMPDTAMYGGFSAVSAYHCGDPASINDTYEKMLAWADLHNFRLRGDCLERRVLDIYSTQDVNEFVTNILLPLDEDSSDLKLMHQFETEL